MNNNELEKLVPIRSTIITLQNRYYNISSIQGNPNKEEVDVELEYRRYLDYKYMR